MNGPEDARDYLWYGQDLWMTDDVWNWANNYMPAKEAILKNCSRPGCQVREKDACEFKRCSDCHMASGDRPPWENLKSADFGTTGFVLQPAVPEGRLEGS